MSVFVNECEICLMCYIGSNVSLCEWMWDLFNVYIGSNASLCKWMWDLFNVLFWFKCQSL